jgi:hypothetical protein
MINGEKKEEEMHSAFYEENKNKGMKKNLIFFLV